MVKLNPKIFKSYDIRGIVPRNLNEEQAFLIGQAYANYTRAKRVAVGRDMRLYSEELSRALIDGLTSQGVEVIDLGLITVDMLYFARGFYQYDGGIMVTASHNPREYNGFKMIKQDGDVIRGIELREFIEQRGEFVDKEKGSVRQQEVYPDFLKHIFSFIDLKKITSLKIVIDAGNGMAGKIIPMMAKKLPCKIIPLFFDLNGNFPNHPSNPLVSGATDALEKKIIEEKADFGVIFDGDTDRIFFIDEKGNFIPADMTLIILARYFIDKERGAGIVYNVVCSRAVPEKIEEMGGRPIRSPVGYVFIRKAMRKYNGVMGGEISAHYAFRDMYDSDSGMMAFLLALQIISEYKKPLSEIVKNLSPYFKLKEINFEIEDAKEVLRKIKDKYKDGKIDELDGVTVNFRDWWFNVRPSNTEPLLRVTIEANSRELCNQKKKELIDFIKQCQ